MCDICALNWPGRSNLHYSFNMCKRKIRCVISNKFLSLFVCILVFSASAEVTEIDADQLYEQAEVLYAGEQYTQAIELLQQAVSIDPNQSRYHHLLGMAYGRTAQQARWFKALSLAKKTRRSFERAVELDPYNEDAWLDLIEFYNKAPAIVGGGKRKAKKAKAKMHAFIEAESEPVLHR